MCKNGRIWRWVDHTVGHSTLNIAISKQMINVKKRDINYHVEDEEDTCRPGSTFAAGSGANQSAARTSCAQLSRAPPEGACNTERTKVSKN